MGLDTGNGTTVALTTASFTASVTSIDIGEQTIEMLPADHLGTTGFMEKIAADLADAGEVTVNFLADVTSAAKFTPPLGSTDTLTITFPEQLTGGAAPTYAGSGVVTSWKPPNLANNELQAGSFTFTWDGYTGPAFTADTGS